MLEARMIGKSASTPPVQAIWLSISSLKRELPEEVAEQSICSDSDDNDVGGEFLIQANTQKRPRLEEENDHSSPSKQSEGQDGVGIMLAHFSSPFVMLQLLLAF